MSSTSSIVTRNIQGVERIINYQFTNPKIICEALLAAGRYLPGIVRCSKDGNKNLAMVGDAVLQLVLVSDGYDKGAINGIVSAKGRNAYLAEQGSHNNLEPFIFKNPSQRDDDVSKGPMADTVEAILGAVWYDSGKDLSAVQAVMETLGLFDLETVI
ncbi:hypothetical protein SI65_04404 [Aspergillus cristatus]|uniref:RNase III domain-containing protein n=1 Tax=Aspergillus cristatus TaxID=573508 RepID=A0A1E3BEN0_ASPCR|nr:hypothetical protein SI65_04404 [Aspergillus cristatus]